jgi:hypothetical protein
MECLKMKYEANVETGELIIRELTAEEIAQDEIDRKMATDRAVIDEQKREAKDAAKAKLEALGLSLDDLKALGLG